MYRLAISSPCFFNNSEVPVIAADGLIGVFGDCEIVDLSTQIRRHLRFPVRRTAFSELFCLNDRVVIAVEVDTLLRQRLGCSS